MTRIFSRHVFTLTCALPALAQIGTATLTGRITDPTGAIVPAVDVLLVNTETNFRFTAITNDEGLYRIQPLSTGPYNVSFQKAGFKTVLRNNIVLHIGDVATIGATLEVGTVTESVEVKASAPLLETETSAAGKVTEGQFLYTLPTFQRFTNYAFNLTPGVTWSGDNWAESIAAFHSAGQRGLAASFEDGVIDQDSSTGSTVMRVLQNSIAEVKILTTVLPAEYGHSAGGATSVVSKTGTNQLHGLASMWGRTRIMLHRQYLELYRATQAGRTFLTAYRLSSPIRIST